jgi:hypothetical protein
MSESPFEDRFGPTSSQRRGGVYAIADVLEELMEQYSARLREVTVVVREEEAVAA